METLWVPIICRWTPKLAHRLCALRGFHVFVTEQGGKRVQPWADDPLRLGTAGAQSLSTLWIWASAPGRVLLQAPLGHPCQVTTDKRADNPGTYTFPLRDGLSPPFQTRDMAWPHAAHQLGQPQRQTQLWECCWNSLWELTEFKFPQALNFLRL